MGALGALGVATPAQAQSLWTWSAEGSVAGTGAGTDPRWVWDAEADPLLASVIDRGDVPRVNALLRTWTKNGQPLPVGMPADVREFMEHARQLPAWTDQGKLATAVRFNEKRGLYLGVLYGLASGMMSTVIPKEARAVYHSKGGADMKDRISKTARSASKFRTPIAPDLGPPGRTRGYPAFLIPSRSAPLLRSTRVS